MAALGRGVGDLGQAIAQINIAEGTSQASTAKGQVKSSIRLLEEELKANNNPETYQEELGIKINLMNNFRPKHPIGARIFDDFIKGNTPIWESGVNILALQKKQSLIEGAYITDRANAQAAPDLEEANRLTEEARDVTGVITPEQAAKDLIINKVVVEKVIEQNAIEAVHAAIEVGSTTGNFETAKLLAQNPLIPEPQQTTLRNAIRSAKTTFEESKVNLRDTAVNLFYEDMAKSLSKDVTSVTLSSISDSLKNLPPKDQDIVRGVFNNRATELGKGNRDPFTIHAPNIFSTIQRTLELDADVLTPSKIFSFVGNGLTPDDFTTLNDFRTFALIKDSPLQRPDVKSAFKFINDIARLESPDTEDDVLRINRFQNDAKQAIMKQVTEGVRGAELQKFTEDLSIPITESAVGNWLGNWWRAHMPHSILLPSGHAGYWWDFKAKPGTRFKRPKTIKEFEVFTDQIGKEFGDGEGKAYYDLWKGDFD